MKPQSIGLFVDDTSPQSIGGVVAKNLFAGNFDGPIVPVHPKLRAIRGALTFPSVADLPFTPDLAVIAQAAESLPALIDALGQRGCRAAVILSTDFDRAGPAQSEVIRNRLLAAARPYGLRIVGPACLGVILPRIGVDASFARDRAVAGDLAFITRSSTLMAAMLDWAKRRGVGFSALLSLGDIIDVESGELLDYLAFDPGTSAILLCIERVAHARTFLSAARAVAQIKPVIVLKAGRLQRPGLSRTCDKPPQADPDAVYHAAFRRAGMLPVNSIGDLVAAARALASGIRVTGNRLSIITNGRGAGVLVSDSLIRHGGQLAGLSDATIDRLSTALPVGWGGANPVNVFSDASASRYAAAVEAVLDDENSDALLVLNCPTAIGDTVEAARSVVTTARRKRSRKPIFTVWVDEDEREESLRVLSSERRIAIHDSPDAAISALMQLFNFHRNQQMLMETPASRPEQFRRDVSQARAIVARALSKGQTELDAPETFQLLSAYRIPIAQGSSDASEAEAAAQPDEVRREKARLTIMTDPQFGPVISFGTSRGPAEIDDDIAFGLPPLNLSLAEKMMAETKLYHRLSGHAGGGTLATDEVALTLVKLAQLACDLDDVDAVDIDPLWVTHNGVRAGACRVWVRTYAGKPGERLAIKPYPMELEKDIVARDGRLIRLRPIRPEDEPALQAFVRAMTTEDSRMRFFSVLKELDHRFAARLTHLDFDREMALIAVELEADITNIIGVVRISSDPERTHAEFAVTIRSDLKGLGLGRLLMDEIIGYVRNRGIGEIWGQVLKENIAMLGLCRRLGFSVQPDLMSLASCG